MRFPVVLAAVTALLASACAAGQTTEREAPPPEPGPATPTPKLPEGAIKRGEDFYLVPIGRDQDGCMMYRTFSLTRLVVQVIYFDDVKGGYTVNRNDALCTLE
ncbi:MAG: hypothetical protein ACE5EM_05505 [Sphingomonadales bacterium]